MATPEERSDMECERDRVALAARESAQADATEQLKARDARIAELEALLVVAVEAIREDGAHSGESVQEILHGLGERVDAKEKS